MSRSQASQFSDNYPSSVFEDNSADTLSFLTSDGPFNIDEDETPTSTPSAPFTRPAVPIPIPPTLECVGPYGKKQFVLWTEMVNEPFLAWWLQTQYGSKSKQTFFNGKRQADAWEHFHQVASISDGTPKVMCKQCGSVMAHPSDRHRGTSTMTRHFAQSVTCQKGKGKTQDIRKLISNGV
jgi:hypothetical protein